MGLVMTARQRVIVRHRKMGGNPALSCNENDRNRSSEFGVDVFAEPM